MYLGGDKIILIMVKDEMFICLESDYDKLIKEYPKLVKYIKVLNVCFYDENEYWDLKWDILNLLNMGDDDDKV